MPLNVTRDHLISLLKHFKPIIKLHNESFFFTIVTGNIKIFS